MKSDPPLFVTSATRAEVRRIAVEGHSSRASFGSRKAPGWVIPIEPTKNRST
jgi:hypothetical protein